MEMHRSGSMKIHLSFHLFQRIWKGREGEIKKPTEMNQRGFAEALCDSALLALDLADENKMHNCMDPLHRGLKRDVKRRSP